MNVGGRVSEVVDGGGRYMVLSEFSFLALSRFLRLEFSMRFKRILSRSCL